MFYQVFSGNFYSILRNFLLLRLTSDRYLSGENNYRGGNGPLHVSRGKMKNPLFKAFIEAAMQCGYPYTEDLNGFQQEGVGPMDMTTYKGKRWSASQAYLRPSLSRKNLKTETNTLVTRVLFEGTKAVGIEYVKGMLVV